MDRVFADDGAALLGSLESSGSLGHAVTSCFTTVTGTPELASAVAGRGAEPDATGCGVAVRTFCELATFDVSAALSCGATAGATEPAVFGLLEKVSTARFTMAAMCVSAAETTRWNTAPRPRPSAMQTTPTIHTDRPLHRGASASICAANNPDVRNGGSTTSSASRLPAPRLSASATATAGSSLLSSSFIARAAGGVPLVYSIGSEFTRAGRTGTDSLGLGFNRDPRHSDSGPGENVERRDCSRKRSSSRRSASCESLFKSCSVPAAAATRIPRRSS